MASTVNWLTLPASGEAGQTVAAAAPTAGNQTVDKETFLRLLVAQIRNQNPLSPADGIQFLTQLAQFSELEQLISMRQDLEALRKAAEQAAGRSGTAGGTQSP